MCRRRELKRGGAEKEKTRRVQKNDLTAEEAKSAERSRQRKNNHGDTEEDEKIRICEDEIFIIRIRDRTAKATRMQRRMGISGTVGLLKNPRHPLTTPSAK